MVVMNLKCPSSKSGSLVLRLALGHILKKGMFRVGFSQSVCKKGGIVPQCLPQKFVPSTVSRYRQKVVQSALSRILNSIIFLIMKNQLDDPP